MFFFSFGGKVKMSNLDLSIFKIKIFFAEANAFFFHNQNVINISSF